MLAVYVKLMGDQPKPTENVRNKKSLETAIKSALTYFRVNYPDHRELTFVRFSKYFSSVKFNGDTYDMLSSRFRSMFKFLGSYVAGDEKLFTFTGNSGDTRLVISKPGRLGFWF